MIVRARRALLVLLLSLLLLSAPASAAAEVLRIGFQKSGALALLKVRGTLEPLFKQQGVEVRWVEFIGGPQMLEALNVGSIDFATTGETPPVFAQAANADLVYVAYQPPSPAGEAIVVRAASPIRSVADLKGRKVALNKGSNVHFLLLRALAEAGLRYSDIKPVYLNPADGRAAFERGSVDAWVIWDPYLAAAQQQLQARVLRDGTGLVANTQFYLARRAYAERHPQQILDLVGHIRALDRWADSHRAEAARQIAPQVGLPPSVVEVAVRRQSFGARFIRSSVVAEQQRIADAFANERLIPRRLSVDRLIWTPPAALLAASR